LVGVFSEYQENEVSQQIIQVEEEKSGLALKAFIAAVSISK
jgi:hypothetical protein